MNIEFRKEAVDDMNAIWLYTKEQWSKEQANHYYNLLVEEINRLGIFPSSGKDCSDFGKGYRYLKVKSHFVFYRITQDDRIEILRVLHENMNFLKRFGK